MPRRHVGTLRRTRLLRQLRSARDRRVSSRSWRHPATARRASSSSGRRRDPGPVAWLTADDSDSDPVVFLTDLATAIDRLEPVGPELFSAIASATVSHRTVVGRLLAAMSRPSEPVRIAIDDAHRITSRACLDVLAELIDESDRGVAGGDRRHAHECASRSPAGGPMVPCSRSVPMSSRWTSARQPGWVASSGLRLSDRDDEHA